EDLVVGEWDLPALLQLFTELEFQVLVEKVKMKMPPGEDMVVVPAPEATPLAAVEHREDTKVVVCADAIEALAKAAEAAGKLAITVELDPERVERARMVAVTIAVPGEP